MTASTGKVDGDTSATRGGADIEGWRKLLIRSAIAAMTIQGPQLVKRNKDFLLHWDEVTLTIGVQSVPDHGHDSFKNLPR